MFLRCCSQGDVTTRAKASPLFPPAPNRDSGTALPITSFSVPEGGVTTDTILEVVLHTPKGLVSDPSGGKHLRAILDSNKMGGTSPLLGALMALLMAGPSGALLPALQPFLCDSQVVGLVLVRKKDGGIRPIVVGPLRYRRQGCPRRSVALSERMTELQHLQVRVGRQSPLAQAAHRALADR